MEKRVRNGVIGSTFLGIEDHGMLTFTLHIDYGSSGQGFGQVIMDGYDEDLGERIGSGFGTTCIRRILETLEVDKWEKLPKTPVRAYGNMEHISCLGHFYKLKWFDLDTYIENYGAYGKLKKEF